MKLKQEAKNAIRIGTLCSVSYLAVYVARNILSAVAPQMIEQGYSETFIGGLSSVYFICYAVGQLINGAIGDKIKARYMISCGLLLAGITNLLFALLEIGALGLTVIYGMTGFFLAMIYGPMTKVVAENTEPVYTTRCSLGYMLSSFLGSPAAGAIAAIVAWQWAFGIASSLLFAMSIVAFFVFLSFEKKGMVKYNQYRLENKAKGAGVAVLIKKYAIVKFCFIAILTGVVRTTVVFWLPTYISQRLGFASSSAAGLFTAATLIISASAFVSIFMYESFKRNMDMTIIVSFSASAVFFVGAFFVEQSVVNIIFMILAVMGNNCAATMMYSRYCPSLRDTGMVSTATGFLDCLSYLAAAVSSSIFANAATSIGWGNLVLVWAALMACGVIVALPYRKWLSKRKAEKNRATPQAGLDLTEGEAVQMAMDSEQETVVIEEMTAGTAAEGQETASENAE